jgi:hypothetical protein
MSKHPTTSIERLHRAFLSGVASLVLLVLGDKFGYHGKFHSWGPAASWRSVANDLPVLIVIAVLVVGFVYFWSGRRDS